MIATPAHQVQMKQSRSRYWFAECICGWTSERKARLAEAERIALKHVREAK